MKPMSGQMVKGSPPAGVGTHDGKHGMPMCSGGCAMHCGGMAQKKSDGGLLMPTKGTVPANDYDGLADHLMGSKAKGKGKGMHRK